MPRMPRRGVVISILNTYYCNEFDGCSILVSLCQTNLNKYPCIFFVNNEKQLA